MSDARPVRTLAVASEKGGSGKTSTVVNLAATLGEKDRRVLVVDLDHQAAASSWLGVRDGGRGLADALTGNGNLYDLVTKTDVSNVSIIPSSEWLMGAEKVLASETILRGLLARLPKEWDYIFLDCPPHVGTLTVSGLAASTEVLVPVAAQYLALVGLHQFLKTVDMVRERLNPGLRVSGVLACRVDIRTRLSLDVVEELRRRFGDLVFRTVVHENTKTAEAPSFHKPITLYDTRASGAEDFRSLAAEVIEHETRRKRT